MPAQPTTLGSDVDDDVRWPISDAQALLFLSDRLTRGNVRAKVLIAHNLVPTVIAYHELPAVNLGMGCLADRRCRDRWTSLVRQSSGIGHGWVKTAV